MSDSHSSTTSCFYKNSFSDKRSFFFKSTRLPFIVLALLWHPSLFCNFAGYPRPPCWFNCISARANLNRLLQLMSAYSFFFSLPRVVACLLVCLLIRAEKCVSLVLIVTRRNSPLFLLLFFLFVFLFVLGFFFLLPLNS